MHTRRSGTAHRQTRAHTRTARIPYGTGLSAHRFPRARAGRFRLQTNQVVGPATVTLGKERSVSSVWPAYPSACRKVARACFSEGALLTDDAAVLGRTAKPAPVRLQVHQTLLAEPYEYSNSRAKPSTAARAEVLALRLPAAGRPQRGRILPKSQPASTLIVSPPTLPCGTTPLRAGTRSGEDTCSGLFRPSSWQ